MVSRNYRTTPTLILISFAFALPHFFCFFFSNYVRFLTVERYRKQDGKEIIIIDGYTFYRESQSKENEVFRCTGGRPCKARFVITKAKGIFKSYNLEHNHYPPRYIIRDGVFIKL